MAIVQVLDKSFIGEGLNAPKLKLIDPIESNGSLLLFDASKYNGELVDNSTIPNLFNDNARIVTGADSHIGFTRTHAPNQSTLERTEKGGIHFIANPHLAAGMFGDDTDKAGLTGTGGLKEYMRIHSPAGGNPNAHRFFITLWYRFTSGMTFTDTNLLFASHYIANYSHNGNHNLEWVFHMQEDIVTEPSPPINYWEMTYPNSAKTLPTESTAFNIFNFGTHGLARVSRQYKKYPSMILYRAYIEDTTVSGRTLTELEELDNQLFNRAFSEGGRFHNDSFTDPLDVFTSA